MEDDLIKKEEQDIIDGEDVVWHKAYRMEIVITILISIAAITWFIAQHYKWLDK